MKRFENEYRFCSVKRHRNIINVVDHGLTDEGAPFFVMPLYTGSLRNLMGKLSPDECYLVVKQLLDGLEASHKLGAIHRDIKPENILYSDTEGVIEIVISDYGIAEFSEEVLFTAVETKDSTRLANFQYAAPEQRIRSGSVNYTTDIYALGLVINELFTGEIPLGKDHRNVANYSEEHAYLDPIINMMLQQNQSSRPQTIEDIKRELSARRKERIALLKVSQLKKVVIPESEIDDPIVADPMKIIDAEWDQGKLTISLNHQVNKEWIWSFHNMGGHTSVMGLGPEAFQLKDNKAIVQCQSRDAQRVINYFNEWLKTIANVYERKVIADAERARQQEQKLLESKIAAEEEKKKVNAGLSF